MIVTVHGRRYDVPPGYVLVEWLGERSPLDEDWVRIKLTLTGQPHGFTRAQAALIREVGRRAILRRRGVRHRRIIRKGTDWGRLPNLSVQKIVWGPRAHAFPGEPGSYVQLLSNHDADLVLQSASGHEFVAYTEDGTQHQGDDKRLVLVPDVTLRVSPPQHMRRGRDTWS